MSRQSYSRASILALKCRSMIKKHLMFNTYTFNQRHPIGSRTSVLTPPLPISQFANKVCKGRFSFRKHIHSPCASRRKQTVTQLHRHIRVCITLCGQSASTFRPIIAKTNTFEISQSGHYCKAKGETPCAARPASHRPCTPAYIVASNNEKRKEQGARVMYSVHANRVILVGVGLATG